MILSLEYRFVFIKGARVGGTSLEMALSTLCGPHDIITPIAPIDELARMRLGARAQNYADNREREEAYLREIQTTPRQALAQVSVPRERYYNHMSLREVIANYGSEVSDFAIMCVERSPYAKILSWANWLASSEDYLSGGRLQSDPKTLRTWVNRIYQSGEFANVKNIELYRNPDGRVTLHALRHMTLEADLHSFVKSRGINVRPPMPHAKGGFLSDHLNPRKFFSDEQLRSINEVYAEEFDVFGHPQISSVKWRLSFRKRFNHSSSEGISTRSPNSPGELAARVTRRALDPGAVRFPFSTDLLNDKN